MHLQQAVHEKEKKEALTSAFACPGPPDPGTRIIISLFRHSYHIYCRWREREKGSAATLLVIRIMMISPSSLLLFTGTSRTKKKGEKGRRRRGRRINCKDQKGHVVAVAVNVSVCMIRLTFWLIRHACRHLPCSSKS
jgi:hypothetical protein